MMLAILRNLMQTTCQSLNTSLIIMVAVTLITFQYNVTLCLITSVNENYQSNSNLYRIKNVRTLVWSNFTQISSDIVPHAVWALCAAWDYFVYLLDWNFLLF